jgi:hypothetical protein
MKSSLFLAWQDPTRRRWYPVGRLTSNGRRYLFVYTGGAREAKKTAGFEPLPMFPDLERLYTSYELFPLFTNRLVPRSRPEYSDYLKWLNVPETEDDPILILARSGGQRLTDTLEVFPCPERTTSGEYVIRFLVHGLRHMPDDAIARVSQLQPGERLLMLKDIQNPVDSLALALRTAETYDKDVHFIGYCPRYLRSDFGKLIDSQEGELTVTVERVNPPPAPIQFRLLCRLEGSWPKGFEPFSSSDYTPLVDASSPAITEELEDLYPPKKFLR